MTARLPAPPLPAWLERMLPFRRYRVAVDGVALHVMEAGEGPPVLMLHGNPTWGFLYRKVARALGSAPLRLVMPDLMGLGLSDKPPAHAHSLLRHAQLIGGLIDALELGPLTFVGQDWGGSIGLRALADRPGLLRGLVVLNTALSPPRPGFRPTLFHRFARVPVLSELAFRGLGFPQGIGMGFAQGRRFSIRGEVARAYRWPLRRRSENAAPLALARMVPDSLEHPTVAPLRTVQELVQGFKGPSEIVWGDRDPVLGRVRTWIEKLLPHARVTRTNGGHFLQEEEPDAIAEAIRRVTAIAANSEIVDPGRSPRA